MALVPPDPAWLRKHVAHEMRHLVFAAAHFTDAGLADSNHMKDGLAVALQDSALVRGRAMIDFLVKEGSPNLCWHLFNFYPDPDDRPVEDPMAVAWFKFISGRTSHLGKNREEPEFDQWPDREPGEDKGEDRLERLARFVVGLLRARCDLVVPECQTVLYEIADRADAYLDDPSDENFKALESESIPLD